MRVRVILSMTLCGLAVVATTAAGAESQPTLRSDSLTAAPAAQPAIARLDAALDSVLAADARLEVLHDDEQAMFEGPTWMRGKGDSGQLIFSVRPGNAIKQLSADGRVSTFIGDIFSGETSTWGANGTTLDLNGRVVYAAFSAGQVVRVEANGDRTILANQFKGQRLNTPNDLVYTSDGSLYFTDSVSKRPGGEGVPHTGLYRLGAGKLALLIGSGVGRLNGLAFSPDEKQLYLADAGDKSILRFDIDDQGALSNQGIFVDMRDNEYGPDGIKVDKQGNVYATGEGGVWIVSPAAKRLGTILTARRATNIEFGGNDGRSLYITGFSFIARVPVTIPGARH